MDGAAAAKALEVWWGSTARDLPWRRTTDPWAILLSEVLLQQTRVATAVEAFPRLLRAYPTPAAMAKAPEQEVLRAWAGLGYYRRARNLRRAAQAIVERHDGAVPASVEQLAALPGVGPYTAAAVHAFAFDRLAAPLDANVVRVAARLTGETGAVEAPAARRRLEAAVLEVMRHGSPRVLGQALIEVGALVCSPEVPACSACPLAEPCVARALGQQEALPHKKAKAAPKQERWAFALAMHQGRVLLEQRGPGLLEGFWALPGVPLQRGALAHEALQEHLAASGVRARVGVPGPEARWAFTHRVWRFRVHPARVVGGAPKGGTRWVGIEDLASLPVAQPHGPHVRSALGPAP